MPDFLVATGDSLVCLSASGDLWRGTRYLEGAAIHHLAVVAAEQNDGWIYAASWGEGLWRSSSGDAALKWSNLASFLESSRVLRLASGEEGAIYAGGEMAWLKRSRDGGLNWEALDNIWLVPSSGHWQAPHVACIAPNPQHEDWLLVALQGVGILFSSDGGFSWDDVRPDSAPDTHQILWHRHNAATALALSPRSIALSHDGGWTWQSSTATSRDELSAVEWCDAACDENGAWLLAGNAPSGGVLWRAKNEWRRLSGWKRRACRLNCVGCWNDWLALGWEDGAIDVSQDGGRSWRELLVAEAAPQSVRDLVMVEWTKKPLEKPLENAE